MTRHLMAVCVVCLLCADHLPCKEHIEDYGIGEAGSNTKYDFLPDNVPHLHTELHNAHPTTIDEDSNLYNKKRGKTKLHSGGKSMEHNRYKRHGSHDHDHDTNENAEKINEHSRIYIRKIFEQFSNSEKKDTLSIEGFEKLLDRLNLYNLKDDTKESHCISSVDLLHRMSGNPVNFKSSNIPNIASEQSHNTTLVNNKNKTTDDDGNVVKKDSMFLSEDDLWAVCPVLLFHNTAQTSTEKSGCITDEMIPPSHYHHNIPHNDIENNRGLVWFYSSMSVLIASLCGLLGVAVIPCMENRFYNQFLQFLVSLAVGTLTGDALLHLLPHSFMTYGPDEDPHEAMIWKGFVAVMGIIFFFFTERGLTIIADWRKNRQKNEKPCSRVRVKREDASTSSVNNVGKEKVCKNKYSSYPYCYDEIANDTKDGHHHHHARKNCDKTTTQPTPMATHADAGKPVENHDNGEFNETAQSLLSNYTINENYTADMHNHLGTTDQQHDNNTVSTNLEIGSVGSTTKEKPDDNYTVILREHESKHHGHSHTHGHVHSPPRSLSAVAWMVVMGDGLHNFTDGMAIGAAFSNSIAGGFSTAIAIFCHELPHELGDFAVLLKAGMSSRQAVYYNILSSVLSFFGMVLGILVGERPEASAWIFACAAGSFIYIALVDMMPEITASHKSGAQLSQCFLQFTGMMLGVGIMVVIALYEHDLKEMFTHDHS